MDANTYSFVNMILLSLLAFLATTVAGLLGYWASYVNKQMAGLHKEQADAKVVMIKLQSWAEAHDKQDDARHDESRATLGNIQEVMHGMEGSATRSPARPEAGGRRRRGSAGGGPA